MQGSEEEAGGLLFGRDAEQCDVEGNDVVFTMLVSIVSL